MLILIIFNISCNLASQLLQALSITLAVYFIAPHGTRAKARPKLNASFVDLDLYP